MEIRERLDCGANTRRTIALIADREITALALVRSLQRENGRTLFFPIPTKLFGGGRLRVTARSNAVRVSMTPFFLLARRQLLPQPQHLRAELLV